MINLEQKGEWGVYFFDIDHVLIYSATIELTPKKYTRNPSIVPGKKNKLVIELGVEPEYYFKKTGLKCLMKRMESLGIINLEDKHRGNTSYDPIRGSLWLDDDYNEDAINDKSICLEYTDHWGYGGSCHCYMELKFSQFEDSFIEALDKSLKSTRIASLKREIELLEAQLESKKTCLKKLKNGNENE